MNDAGDQSGTRELAQLCAEEGENFRLVFDQGPLGIALLDPAARVLRANPRFLALLGYAEAELLGHSILEFTHPEDVEADRANLSELIAGRIRHQAIEKRYLTRAGASPWVRVVRGRVVDGAGGLRYLLTMVEDISDRKRAEEALRAQQEMQRVVFNSTHDALVVHDLDGRLLQANATALRMYGMPPERIGSYTVADLTGTGMSMELVHRHWERTVGGGGESPLFEWCARRVDDGTEFDVEVVLRRVAPDNRAAVLANVRDITARKRLERELRESREDLNRAQAVAHTGSWRLDVRRNVLDWSDENYRIFGRPAGTPLTYETFLSMVDPADRERVDRAWQAALRGAPYDIEHRINAGGQVRWVRERAQLEFDAKGVLTGGFGTAQDVTDKKQAEEELRTSRDFVEKVMQSVGNAVYVLDLEGRFTQVNRAAIQICGYAEEELLGRPFSEFVVPDARAALAAAFTQVTAHQVPINDLETEIRHKNGSSRYLIVNAMPLHAQQATCVVASAQDITGRKRIEEEMRHMAQHDVLTGLPNRRLLTEILSVALPHARRTGTRLAVLFVDLDRFKEINDTHGHEAGDALLTQVATRLRQTVRSTDTVARVGGDEFNVALTAIRHGERAAEVAWEIIGAIAEPFTLREGLTVAVTTSIGIAIFPEDGATPEELIGHADRAMYSAKEQGRNTYRFFSPRMHREAQRRADDEAALRRALERRELELHYQPAKRLDTGEVMAMEALLRWRHPERGMLAPAEFLTLAEESGLTIPIGRWVLATACRQAAQWQHHGAATRVSVNLSRKQFQHPELEQITDEALRSAGLAPECLELEVAEEVVMDDLTASTERLRRLQARGVRVAVDDFGTGRTSLPGLQRLPISAVKVDETLIRDIGVDDGADAMLQAVIALSHGLALQVVAEGVETQAQLAFLTRHGCDGAQGNLIGAPVPAPEIRP